ncbi:hypothetical protein Tco_0992722 [Tanacetum coccineum]|uniref:Uncharacterized protein n=1 Tax=Tanacetum coccineum TaxID=301880 RepID=A0ABQ5F3L6_9ASTR
MGNTRFRVVIAFTSPFGLAMVLLGRESGPEVEVLSKSDLDIPGAGGTGAGACQLTADMKLLGVEEIVLTLEYNGLAS